MSAKTAKKNNKHLAFLERLCSQKAVCQISTSSDIEESTLCRTEKLFEDCVLVTIINFTAKYRSMKFIPIHDIHAVKVRPLTDILLGRVGSFDEVPNWKVIVQMESVPQILNFLETNKVMCEVSENWVDNEIGIISEISQRSFRLQLFTYSSGQFSGYLYAETECLRKMEFNLAAYSNVVIPDLKVTLIS